MWWWLVACRTEEPAACEYPETAAAIDGTLVDADSCSRWTAAVDDHVIVKVGVVEDLDPATEENEIPGCTATFETDVLALNSDPIYGSFGDEGPAWTFDFVATTAGETEVVIGCDDGAEWLGIVEVE
jgi:hypothetical protein